MEGPLNVHANCAYGSIAPMPYEESLPDGPYTPELEPFQAQDGDSLRLSDSFPKVSWQPRNTAPGCDKEVCSAALAWIRGCKRCASNALQNIQIQRSSSCLSLFLCWYSKVEDFSGLSVA